MTHSPNWHIINSSFVGSNCGLMVPIRRVRSNRSFQVCRNEADVNLYNHIVTKKAKLKIANLDRFDPPNYQYNSVPRGTDFNSNEFSITSDPRMPRIEVECEALGFDPKITPIMWRLQCRHVLCRHSPQGNYQYSGVCDILEDEWQGKSETSKFVLFDPNSGDSTNLIYTYNDLKVSVMGGHAILSVAARPIGISTTLLDYVHLRISGNNPEREEVLRYIDSILDNHCDRQIVHMLRAIFSHEANFEQFKTDAQTGTRMTFRQRHHKNDASQPNCVVRFDWPNDPPNYPLSTFDFGVGISQYTRTRGRIISHEVAWDWRENLKIGINYFLKILRRQYQAKITWRGWAMQSWSRYNGTGEQAQQYAKTLANSTEGRQVKNISIPNNFDVEKQTKELTAPPRRSQPPAWPPPCDER